MASAERENTYSFIDPLCGKYAFHIFCSEWEGITADLELRFSIVLSTLDELEDIVSDYSKIQAQFLATKTIMYNGTIAYAYEHVKGQGALSTPGGGRIFDDVIIYTDRSIKELVFDLFTEEKIRLMTTEEIEASVLRYIEWLEFYVDALVCLSSSYGTMTICKYDKTKDIEV